MPESSNAFVLELWQGVLKQKKCSILHMVVKYMFFNFSYSLQFLLSKALAMLYQTDHESEKSSNAKHKK